jgi:hypothetical protein
LPFLLYLHSDPHHRLCSRSHWVQQVWTPLNTFLQHRAQSIGSRFDLYCHTDQQYTGQSIG